MSTSEAECYEAEYIPRLIKWLTLLLVVDGTLLILLDISVQHVIYSPLNYMLVYLDSITINGAIKNNLK